MGLLLTRLFYRGEYETGRVKKVYDEIVAIDDMFYIKMYTTMFARHKDVSAIFIAKDTCKTEEEKEYVISTLADTLGEFFATLMKNSMFENENKFRKFCLECGARHANYVKDAEKWKGRYMDIFTMTLINQLEATGRCTNRDISAWMCLLRRITNLMIEGLENADHQNTNMDDDWN